MLVNGWPSLLIDLVPPLIRRLARTLKHAFAGRAELPINNTSPEWEYVPAGWAERDRNANLQGWNVPAVRDRLDAHWPLFLEKIAGTGPLGVAPESQEPRRDDPIHHNIVMSFGYTLALAVRNKSRLSFLDWGGGLGHYYWLAQALLPDMAIDYYCKDVPLLAQAGQAKLPQARFCTDDTCLARRYDLVLASGSLQFSQDWQETLGRLAAATQGYFLLTNLPVVATAPSFVFVQRPYAYGYDTEYLGWCLNRAELIQTAAACGLQLVRELIVGHRPVIRGAPEQNEYRGFLFRNRHQGP